jgi:hypothetical protein
VALWHHQHQRIVAKRPGLQVLAGRGGGDDAQVGHALGNGLHDAQAWQLLHVDAHPWVLDQILRQQLGQVLGQRRGVAQQAHLALLALGVLCQVVLQALHLLRRSAACVLQQAWPAGVGCTPRRLRSSNGMPSEASMARMRALAAGSDRWLRRAPAVMLPHSRVCWNSARSVRSKCISLCPGKSLAEYMANFQAAPATSGWPMNTFLAFYQNIGPALTLLVC